MLALGLGVPDVAVMEADSGGAAPTDDLLLESSGHLLLESSGALKLET